MLDASKEFRVGAGFRHGTNRVNKGSGLTCGISCSRLWGGFKSMGSTAMTKRGLGFRYGINQQSHTEGSSLGNGPGLGFRCDRQPSPNVGASLRQDIKCYRLVEDRA